MLQSRLATLTAELAVTEHAGSGGWAWENIDISPGLLTTAFTWRALLEAKANGVVVSDMMMKRTAAFVAGRYGGIGATDFERKEVVLQSMAAAGTAEFSLLNSLYRVRATLTPVALVRLCAAFIHAGREAEAKEVLALVMKTGTAGKTAAGEDMLFWPGSKDVAGLNAPEEATAAALWCAARLNPAAPEARRIANWLLTSQASAPGGSTRCRRQVMQALAEYARSLPRAAAGDTVEVLADGKVISAAPGEIVPMPADGKLTVRVKGVSPAVVVAALVRATPPVDPKTWEYPTITSRTYLHDNYVLGDTRLDTMSTSPVTTAAHGQLLRVVMKIANHPDETWQAHGNFLQIDEEIPAGCLLVEGSLRSNAQSVERNGNRLRLRYGPGIMGHVSYEVIALTPGNWTARAAVLADPYDPARCRRGTANTLTILPPGQPSAEAYVMNRDEHMEVARLLFERNKAADCLVHLDALAGGKLSQDEERDTARMRLWILADLENADARAMIGAFELLTERHPRLVIPFEKLLRVGDAYHRLNEFERAATVFRAALDGAFLADSGLGVALEDAGDHAGGVDLQEQLWREYPDSQDVIGSLIGLAQSLAAKAPEAETLFVRHGRKKLEKNALLTRSRDLLERYITLQPAEAIAWYQKVAAIYEDAAQAIALFEEKRVSLPVKEEGAYPAIVRGDNLFTSGLVLISPLKLEVKENPEGRVRATVTDAATGKALADAEVKALGNAGREVQSGTTDPRGVFEVGGIQGTSTVIVKQGDNRYAFHRGTMVLRSNMPQEVPQSSGGAASPKPSNRKVLEKGEYLKHIDESNKAVQKQQIQSWDSKRRANSKGVEASDVMSK